VLARPSPVTASPLNQGWLRLTGRDRWPAATATVFSVDWITRSQLDTSFGHYRVVVTYSVEGDNHTGKFVDFGLQDDECFHRGDTLQIRYNPKQPSKFYYPDLRTQSRFRLICFVIGVLLAIVVMLFAVVSKRL
jgi:hypothetical protein